MVGVNFFGNFDLASLSIWLFWLFFAGLIYYLQTENMREGYPLQDEDGNPGPNSTFPMPSDKTFTRPFGQPSVTVPSGQRPDRADLALARSARTTASPIRPPATRSSMAWVPPPGRTARTGPNSTGTAMRRSSRWRASPTSSSPPGATRGAFRCSPRTTRSWRMSPTCGSTLRSTWSATSRWNSSPSTARASGSSRSPWRVSRRRWVEIASLKSGHFAGVPRTASDAQITKLEEDKICAYYAGGKLYS
jgi:photosynthetic reaction center H subunit